MIRTGPGNLRQRMFSRQPAHRESSIPFIELTQGFNATAAWLTARLNVIEFRLSQQSASNEARLENAGHNQGILGE